MRRAGFALASFLCAAPAVAQQPAVPGVPAPLQAQPPVPPPAPAPVDPAVLQNLKGWEAAMSGVKTFAVKAVMTSTDQITKRSEKFDGDIWCMAPNMTRLNLVKQLPPGAKANGEEFTAFICNGKVVYHYDGAAKTLSWAKLGPNGSGNNMMLDIMAGMTAKAALERFEVKALQPKVANDPYVYLELRPKLKEDKGEFEVMQLVLIGPTVADRAYIPRLVKVTKPGGQKVDEWDFPDPKVNPKGIEEKHFQYEKPPLGWKVQTADAPPITPVPARDPKGLVAPPPMKN